jgi:ABC-2 type transport system ATP-binding protein
MIDVQGLTRRFGQVTAVRDVTFQIETGEVVGLLGPNGAGKTTVMRMLTGYLPATSADRLVVAGHDVLRESLAMRQHLGYLPEAVPLYREMRVEEMMRFQARLHRMDRRDAKHRIAEVLERVGVTDRARQQVGRLSRGLRQRVGLAVALLPAPDVLILDEPTSGLDPIQRIEVRTLIRELAADHTVLVSSHILAEIDAICPRVLVMTEGNLVADGTGPELVHQYAGNGHILLEAFVGPDPDEAARLLKALPGVTEVEVGEKLGIHQGFRVRGEGDLREDVGALSQIQGWALRELTWVRPSLEDLFAKLVIGASLEPSARASAEAARAATADAASPESMSLESMTPALEGTLASGLQLGAPSSASAPTAGAAPEAPKMIYSLNPFDRGAERDLGAPVSADPDVPATDADDPTCNDEEKGA